jgi:hypothetical protein
MSRKCELVLAIAGAVMLPALWTANAAEAPVARQPRTFNSTVTHTGPAGSTITRQSTLTTNGHGGYTASSTWIGPKGNTLATGRRSGIYDPATKTYRSSGTLTGANGRQASYNTTVQATGNGYIRNSTVTGPNGNSATVQGQGTYNSSSGTFNQSRTTTFPNGQTATENRAVTVAPAGQIQSN